MFTPRSFERVNRFTREQTRGLTFVVRRAVTLGLPVILVGQQSGHENVIEDYLSLTDEIVRQVPPSSTATSYFPAC